MNKSAKSTAIYVRVSTCRQDHASQLGDLERWASAHDGSVTWHREKWTGSTMERPEMDRLISDLHVGKLDRIVVWRLDRLGRTAKGLCQLFDDLRARKVDLVSLRDGFTLNTPAGRLHARILASVAEYENEVRRERQLAGIEAYKARLEREGRRHPGGRPCGSFKVDPARAAQLAAKGLKRGEIARALGVSLPTLRKMLAVGPG